MNEPMRLLTDEEICKVAGCAIANNKVQGHCPYSDKKACIIFQPAKLAASAQLALGQQHEQERVESIFKEIESKEEQDMQSDTFTVSESMEWWQSLKKQEGVT